MNTEFIKGVVVPIITVIDQDEKIDEAGMRKQVEYVIKGGLQGILAFGSNGEFYQLEEDEMERGLKIMVDQAAGRVPVYFGIGAINMPVPMTAHMMEVMQELKNHDEGACDHDDIVRYYERMTGVSIAK